MLEPQPLPSFSRLPEPLVPKSALQKLQAQKALEKFLADIKRMQAEKRKAYFGPGKKYNVSIPASIAKPQVFFSYAWGKMEDTRFVQLQTFLKQLEELKSKLQETSIKAFKR